MKKIFTFLLSFVLFILPITGCSNKENSNTIRINEVTHSVFYAPLYLAIELGYFEEENIEISLTNGGGADKVMTAVVSKSADIGLMGPETVLYVMAQGKKDAPKVFADLTQKDGAFLLSRKAEPNFTLESLRGKDILAGRAGGVPAMSFEYILHQVGMKNGVDYTLNFGVQFNLMTPAFESGTGDYCTMFEPTASEFEKAGKGYIVASMGELSGEIPYTCFIALESYLDDNPDVVKGFLRAIKKGINYLTTHTDEEVAKSLEKQFVGTSLESLKTSIKNYRAVDAWKTDLVPTKSGFDRLQDVMAFSGELSNKIPYEDVVDISLLNQINT
jgi:NitT/TauT family transport system substrate-binding protein